MSVFFMKNKHAAYPLSIRAFFATIVTISTLLTACDLNINKSETAQSKAVTATVGKTIRTISYLDNGAVVPFPVKQQVTFLVEDSTKIDMIYAEMGENREPTNEKLAISDPARRDDVYDNLLELADFPDGVDIKPGKQPCVGSRSIDIAITFTNGDTTNFSIMGGARCDRTLCAPFWALDSLANLLRTTK
jgi:hypothetical protein